MDHSPPPDPGQAHTLADMARHLRLLKQWAGDPSFETITTRVNASSDEVAGRTTVLDCFRPGRRRVNVDLVLDIVAALHSDPSYVARWRRALRVLGGERAAAAQVRVRDALPADEKGFTGREAEIGRLRALLPDRGRDGPPAVAAISGMAGAGKTRLAVHVAHLLTRERSFDHVLFVDLRGYHADPDQPPADPDAVVEGFLRLLGVPGRQIPHDRAGRAALYRQRISGRRCLVVLDNAAGDDQLGDLVADEPGGLTVVTSRRRPALGPGAGQLTLNAFTPAEAARFLAEAAADVPAGPDAGALARVAEHCGYLPLALGLTAGHLRGRPGWTMTDHADRLAELRAAGALEGGVEAALEISYGHLPADRQRLLRLVVLHPAQDFDAHAAAALAGTEPTGTKVLLEELARDHLVHPAGSGRYGFHDLVRAFAAHRAADDERPSDRRAALDRLGDYYLAASSAAMDVLYPAEINRRPSPPSTDLTLPGLDDLASARAWLDGERPALLASARGSFGYCVQLAAVLFRYADGGHHADALLLHRYALRATIATGDLTARANALHNVGAALLHLGRFEEAGEHHQTALALFEQTGDPVGEARTLGSMGFVDVSRGRFALAGERTERALTLFRQCGDRPGEARALHALAIIASRQGRFEAANSRLDEALALYQRAGDRDGEAITLRKLGEVWSERGRFAEAATALGRALELFTQLGNRSGQGWAHLDLGHLRAGLGQAGPAADHYRRALGIHRETGDQEGEATAHNGLGEAALIDGRPADALAEHRRALAVAGRTGDSYRAARAHAGLARASRALGDEDAARERFGLALRLYEELGIPEADRVRAEL